MLIEYARVSTDGQFLALGLDVLRGVGVQEIFEDVGSGVDCSTKNWPGALSAPPATCWWHGKSSGWAARRSIWSGRYLDRGARR